MKLNFLQGRSSGELYLVTNFLLLVCPFDFIDAGGDLGVRGWGDSVKHRKLKKNVLC